jgi:serine O-acetyltransferase
MNDTASKASREPLPFWRSLHADALAHIPPEKRPPSDRGAMSLVIAQLFKSPGMRCALVYRLSHTLRHRLPVLGIVASRVLFWFGRHSYGCSIAGTARIGGGLILPHPQGIVIGGDVCIGKRAWIFQNVTIGGAPDKAGMPAIGDDARIFAGAVISGPIALGSGVIVGANSVVTIDAPDRSLVRSPASSISPL